MADGSNLLTFPRTVTSAAIFAAKPCAHSELRQLEADFDGTFSAHREDTSLDVSMVGFEEDARHLIGLARCIADAATHLSALTQNTYSTDGRAAQDEEAAADLLEYATDGLLTPSAARVLGAAIKVRLAGGAI